MLVIGIDDGPLLPLSASAASLFSEIHDASPVTSAENSQIRVEEAKPPVSEAPLRTVSSRSDSYTIVTDSADWQGAFGRPALWGPCDFQQVYDHDQHDPTIHDTQSPYVDLTAVPTGVQGITRPPSLRSDLPEETLLGSGNADGPRAGYFTPGPNGEVGDSRTFDSAAGIRVIFSESGSGPRDVACPARRVAVVQPAAGRIRSEDSLPIRPPEPPRHEWPSTGPSSGMIDVKPRHELRMLLNSPPQNTQGVLGSKETEGPRDPTFSFSSSFGEFRSDAGPSQGTLEVGASTTPIPGHESGSQPGSQGSDRGLESDIGGVRGAAFPRFGMRRVVPGWGVSEGKHREKGKESGDRSHLSIPTGHVSVSNETEDLSRDRNPTPASPTQQGMMSTTQDDVFVLIQRSHPRPSFVEKLLAKLGVRKRKPSRLRASPP